MSRRSHGRLGLYYMILRGTEGRMFHGNEDYPSFIRVLDPLMAETCYRLHAICLLPTQAHLALQMSEISLADFAHRLSLKYNRWLQQQYGRLAGGIELARAPRLVDEDSRSRELIRLIHLLPLKSGHDPETYSWSGHRTYLGRARIACLETRTALKLFDQDLPAARIKYEQYIQEGLAAARAANPVRRPAGKPDGHRTEIRSLDDLIAAVAARAGRPAADVLSGSRERSISLLRAVITWHATHLEIATLGDITRYLRRDRSTLYLAIKRYIRRYPALFREPGRFEALAEAADVGSPNAASSDS